MTLTELKYIVAVADQRHFGRAAERSFVTQPTLSAAVKNLEEELGAQLFERGAGEVRMTEVGAGVVAQARRVLEEAEHVKTIARQGRNPLEGPLRLGVIHTVAPYLLPDLAAALRQIAPDMPLDVEENMTANLDQMLRGGAIDAAILALPFEAPGVELAPLYDEEFVVIVPARHSWARRKSVSLAELGQEDLLLLSIGHCFRDQVLDACREFSRPPAAGKQGNSLETIRNMVATGMGISVLPRTALSERYATKLVKAVEFAPPRPSRRVVIAYRKGFSRLPAVQALGEAIRTLDLPVWPIVG